MNANIKTANAAAAATATVNNCNYSQSFQTLAYIHFLDTRKKERENENRLTIINDVFNFEKPLTNQKARRKSGRERRSYFRPKNLFNVKSIPIIYEVKVM